MITIPSMRKIATEAKSEWERLSVLHPPGTFNEARNDARVLYEKAEKVADYMEANGITQAVSCGPFGAIAPEKGSEVVVARGARIYSTAPGYPREGIVSPRRQKIKVHSCHPGWIDPSTGEIRNAAVHWAGTGGYWRWTDINNMEPVDQG